MKLSLCADDMIVHIENPIDSTKKLLDVINEFGKIEGFNVNIQKSKGFLYNNNETSEAEIRGKIPFDIAKKPKNKKNPGINLTKEVKDLYSKNYATLKKTTKEDTNKCIYTVNTYMEYIFHEHGNIYCVHGLEELTSSKCPYYQKQFIDSIQYLLKYS